MLYKQPPPRNYYSFFSLNVGLLLGMKTCQDTSRTYYPSGNGTPTINVARQCIGMTDGTGATTWAYTYGNALIRKEGEMPLFDGLGSER